MNVHDEMLQYLGVMYGMHWKVVLNNPRVGRD